MIKSKTRARAKKKKKKEKKDCKGCNYLLPFAVLAEPKRKTIEVENIYLKES